MPARSVTLVSGPVTMPDPPRVTVVKVETARDMLAAVEAALPADVAVFAAAVADWRTASNSREKIKKTGKGTPELALVENPDILATIAHRKIRPPTTRHRLCGGNRERGRTRQNKACSQGLRLDPRQ